MSSLARCKVHGVSSFLSPPRSTPIVSRNCWFLLLPRTEVFTNFACISPLLNTESKSSFTIRESRSKFQRLGQNRETRHICEAVTRRRADRCRGVNCTKRGTSIVSERRELIGKPIPRERKTRGKASRCRGCCGRGFSSRLRPRRRAENAGKGRGTRATRIREIFA